MIEKLQKKFLFQIQRIYVKDISFETSNTPKIFEKIWDPKVDLNLNSSSKNLEKYIYEVILRITVTTVLDKEIAFLCEVHQAGIFAIQGIQTNQITHCLGVYCPNVLFPYARECVFNLVNRGSFPQLNLDPINFNALFEDYLNKRKIL